MQVSPCCSILTEQRQGRGDMFIAVIQIENYNIIGCGQPRYSRVPQCAGHICASSIT